MESPPERTAIAAKSGVQRGPAISVIIAIEDHRSSGLAVLEAFFDQTAPCERFEPPPHSSPGSKIRAICSACAFAIGDSRWRWKLAAAYRFGYRRQVRRARESRPLPALESATRPG